MELKEQIQEMEELLYKTHDMVQKMYSIVVGADEYKDASIIAQVAQLKKEVQDLKEDKIKRDAKISLLVFLSGSIGTVIGGLIVAFLTK